MSFDEQNLAAFIELLNDKRSSLFSAQDRAALAQLIAPLPDDIEKWSVAIAAWYEKRPKILDAQLDLINKNQTISQKAPGSTSGNIKPPEILLNDLKNAIHQSSQIRKPPSPPTQK